MDILAWPLSPKTSEVENLSPFLSSGVQIWLLKTFQEAHVMDDVLWSVCIVCHRELSSI